jgi:hypothetical protein
MHLHLRLILLRDIDDPPELVGYLVQFAVTR